MEVLALSWRECLVAALRLSLVLGRALGDFQRAVDACLLARLRPHA